MFKYNREITFAKNTSHGEILALIGEGERILEFGCAKGELAGEIKQSLNGHVWGIEIDKGAFEIASENLEGGVVCDIENYKWENEFEGAFFDTLLFADVLEHLRDPAGAIKRALPLLKDDGKIIFSVPNIAHSDIIIKLLNNRFDYTDIGLLDNTHIHFFARENLLPFCEDSEIFPTYITGTTTPTGTTEQRLDKKSAFAFDMAISAQENSDVYQFVILAKKKAFATDEKTVWELNEEISPSTVYFDTGAGFNAEQSSYFECGEGNFNLQIDLPENTSRIRIDIREQAGFVIKNMRCEADGIALNVSEHHHLSIIDDIYLLFKNDPQLVFDIPEGARAVHFSGSLSNAFKSDKSVAYELSSALEGVKKNYILTLNHAENLENHAKNLEDAIRTKDEAISTLNGIIDELRANNEVLSRDIALFEAQLNETKAELDHYKTHYLVAISQREDLKRQLADMTYKYNVISKRIRLYLER